MISSEAYSSLEAGIRILQEEEPIISTLISKTQSENLRNALRILWSEMNRVQKRVES